MKRMKKQNIMLPVLAVVSLVLILGIKPLVVHAESEPFDLTDAAVYTESENYDDFVEYVKTNLMNRETEFDVRFILNEVTDPSPIFYQVIDDACAEPSATSVTNEGDYLSLNIKRTAAKDPRGSTTGGKTTYSLVADMVYHTTKEEQSYVETETDRILGDLGIGGMSSELDKLDAIYGYICSHVKYDRTFTKYSAYNALHDGSSVCQGYSSLTYMMLRKAGLNCRVITGTAQGTGDVTGNHAWNIVQIDGSWYNIDTTWDAGAGTRNWYLQSNGTFKRHEPAEKYTSAEFTAAYPISDSDYYLCGYDLWGHQIVIDGSINLVFSFVADDEIFASGKNTSVELSWGEGKRANTETFDIDSITPEVKPGTTISCYDVRCNLVAAQLSDNVKVMVYQDGKASYPFYYSVRDYAQELIEYYPAEYGDLAKAMLNYGAYSQIYFGYRTDDLANNILDVSDNPVPSANHTQIIADIESKYEKSENLDGISYWASSLDLSSNIKIRHYFALEEGEDIGDYTFLFGGNNVTPTEWNGYYCIESIPLRAYFLDKDVWAQVINKSRTKSSLIHYSVLDYVRLVLDQKDSLNNPKLVDLSTALYYYFKAAQANN